MCTSKNGFIKYIEKYGNKWKEIFRIRFADVFYPQAFFAGLRIQCRLVYSQSPTTSFTSLKPGLEESPA